MPAVRTKKRDDGILAGRWGRIYSAADEKRRRTSIEDIYIPVPGSGRSPQTRDLMDDVSRERRAVYDHFTWRFDLTIPVTAEQLISELFDRRLTLFSTCLEFCDEPPVY